MNVPKLRFKGFEGEWEKAFLKDVIDVKSGKDYKHLDKGDIPVYGTGGYMLSVNDFLSAENAIGIGRKGSIDKPQKLMAPFWTVDTLFYCLPRKNNTYLFLFTLFQKIRWKKYDESTGVPSLSKNTIEKIKVFLPSVSEQQKIGLFFEKLERKIQLHQEKIDLLQKQKKGFLQKIFNQGQWEEYSLAKIMDFYKGKGIAKKDLTVSGIPCVLYGELYTTYGEVVSKIYSKTNIENSNLFKSMKQDILIPSSGETAIDIACATCLLEEDVLIGGDLNIMRIKPDKQVDGRFISYQINSVKKRELSKYAQGASVVHLYNSDIKKLKVALPNIEDQKKIADFFEALDKKIDLELNKLIHLKEQKEGFLQQMFI